MAKKKDTSSKIPRTPAYMRFEHNLSKVKIFINQSTQRVQDKQKVIKRSGRLLQSAIGSDAKTRVRCILKTAGALQELTEDLAMGFFAFSEWTAVMLMTFVQEYIEESLVTVVEKKMAIIKDVKPIEWERIRECQSLEELTQSVKREWAQSRMRGRKIREWFNVFEKLGAEKYNPVHCETLLRLRSAFHGCKLARFRATLRLHRGTSLRQLKSFSQNNLSLIRSPDAPRTLRNPG